jgi:diguanylate cyclase (GGDEF)-like protein
MTYNTRILIVDDNESIHEDFLKVLSQKKTEALAELDDLESELFGNEEAEAKPNPNNSEQPDYRVDSAYQGREALEMVEKAVAEGAPYALIFMDVRMPPGWDGIETISHIWAKHPYIEMVLCTAYSDYTWDDILEKLGSTDRLLFLRKPFDAVAVQQMALSLTKKWNLGEQARNYVSTLEHEVEERTKQLQELLKKLESQNAELSVSNDELKHAALHDPLTELPNRILFHDRLHHAIELAHRNKQDFAVALMDLNDFKGINDVHGHLAGDKVLRAVAQRSRSALRASDTVARLGGDEFAFILPTVGAESPVTVAGKILATLDEPIDIGSSAIFRTNASIGVALYPGHGIDTDHLLAMADTAMYKAKRSGGGVHVYDGEMETTTDVEEAGIEAGK